LDPLIRIRNLYRVYHMGEEKVYALRGVNLDIQKEEILCLLGTSGSGKSTLLNMMAGLDRPTKGEIIINNKIHMEKLSEEKLTKFRQLNVGFVFQSYNLIPTLTATENVSLGLIFKGVKKQEREEKARAILERVGLGNRLDHKPSEMSGGQQQRVSIARAMAKKPSLFICDEPTGALDYESAKAVLHLIEDLNKKHKTTILMATHNEAIASMCHVILRLHDGSLKSYEENKHILSAKEVQW